MVPVLLITLEPVIKEFNYDLCFRDFKWVCSKVWFHFTWGKINDNNVIKYIMSWEDWSSIITLSYSHRVGKNVFRKESVQRNIFLELFTQPQRNNTFWRKCCTGISIF